MKHIDSSSSQVHVFEILPQLHGDNCTESIISEISGILSPVQREDGTSMEPKMILINGAPGIECYVKKLLSAGLIDIF